jgi:hypothetical protein
MIGLNRPIFGQIAPIGYQGLNVTTETLIAITNQPLEAVKQALKEEKEVMIDLKYLHNYVSKYYKAHLNKKK